MSIESMFWGFLGGLLLGAVGAWIVFVITRRQGQMMLEEQKSRLKSEQMDRLDEMKQRILAGISQELLPTLSHIIGPLQKLVNEPLGSEVTARIQMLLRNAQMLLHQVNMLSVGTNMGAASESRLASAADPRLLSPDAQGAMSDNNVESYGIDDNNAAEVADMKEEKEENEDSDLKMALSHRFTMLMVDDSADMCRFVRDYFRGEYNVITANNGEEAVKNLNEIDNIDLVVSDVAMPKMDGLELCKLVKNDLRWSHIPVILLTGHTGEDMEVEGLKMGADDYITKPFNAEMLRLRVRNLIEKKANRQKQFREKADVAPSEITITSVDEMFIQKAIKICEDHMADMDFSVEVLGKELSMSRTYLYKKLMNITGRGPSEFIRILRLKRGQQYLEQSDMQIADIATHVGYNSPKRFTENFKTEFGMSPSEYVRKLRRERKGEGKS